MTNTSVKSSGQLKVASIVILALAIFLPFVTQDAYANPKSPRTVYGADLKVVPIKISRLGVVLSFPVKPSKVVLGKADSFGIEYVSSDLVVSPLGANSSSLLFVYLSGRRFTFLLQSSQRGDSVVDVKDKMGNQMKFSNEK